MKILIANDDGINSDGIKALVNQLKKNKNYTIVVVAPNTQRTANGHACTITGELKVEKISFDENIVGYSVYGTPRDCVEVGLTALCPDADLVISGINEGSNLASDIPCSGTCGAACTAIFYNVPSIAVSLAFGKNYDYTDAAQITEKIVEWFVNQPFKNDFILNVNIPNIPKEQIKGVRATRLGAYQHYSQFNTYRFDGQYYYFGADGTVVTRTNEKKDLDHDIYAVNKGYISFEPLDMDLICNKKVNVLKENLKDFII